MYKSICAAAICLFVSGVAKAQLSFAASSISVNAARGFTSKPALYVKNIGTNSETFEWQLDTKTTYLPGGYTGISVCALPGNCYQWDFATHTEILAPGDSMAMEPGVDVTLAAPLDTAAQVGIVIGTGLNATTLRYTITAVSWPTSIANNIAGKMHITPNPATNTIQVHGQFATIQIFNIQGQAMQCTPTIFTDYASCDISALPAGTYVVEAHTLLGTRLNTKLVVRK